MHIIKIIAIRLVVTLCAGLALSNPTLATPDALSFSLSGADVISAQTRCHIIATELNRLANLRQDHPCSGDLKVAATYIEFAEMKLRNQKTDEALTAIQYGALELQEISLGRAYCSNYSQEVKPMLTDAAQVISSVESSVVRLLKGSV